MNNNHDHSDASDPLERLEQHLQSLRPQPVGELSAESMYRCGWEAALAARDGDGPTQEGKTLSNLVAQRRSRMADFGGGTLVGIAASVCFIFALSPISWNRPGDANQSLAESLPPNDAPRLATDERQFDDESGAEVASPFESVASNSDKSAIPAAQGMVYTFISPWGTSPAEPFFGSESLLPTNSMDQVAADSGTSLLSFAARRSWQNTVDSSYQAVSHPVSHRSQIDGPSNSTEQVLTPSIRPELKRGTPSIGEFLFGIDDGQVF